jgi:hypothetical protein
VRTRMHTGGDDTNTIGVGALVYVPWRCGPPFNRKPPRGFKKGHFVLRPYWPLYRSARDLYCNRRRIKHPPAKTIKLFRDSG